MAVVAGVGRCAQRSPSVKRFWIECGEATFALEPRPLLIGRSKECYVVVDDAAVSRRHARLNVGATEVTIEDLGSANGVFVNGNRITGVEVLEDGDQIQVGSVALVLKSEAVSVHDTIKPAANTIPGLGALARAGELGLDLDDEDEAEARAAAARGSNGKANGGVSADEDVESDVDSESEHTVHKHALDMLGVVADKVLALGRADDAERMLQHTLFDVLKKAQQAAENRGGQRGPQVPRHTCAKAAEYAVRLADATGRGQWVDYAVSLYAALGRPLPAEVVDQLYETVRKVPGIDRAALQEYAERMRRLPDLSAAERFVSQRLQGLVRLISARGRP